MSQRNVLTRKAPACFRFLADLLIVSILCCIVVVPTAFVVFSNDPQARQILLERFDRVAVGDAKERVLEILGPPGLICVGSKGIYPHQIWAERRVWAALEKATAERWIYPIPFEEAQTGQRSTQTEVVPTDHSCRPGYAEGEVGFDQEGKVRWFIPLTDESYVTHRKPDVAEESTPPGPST